MFIPCPLVAAGARRSPCSNPPDAALWARSKNSGRGQSGSPEDAHGGSTMRTLCVAAALGAAATLSLTTAAAQDFPNKPLKAVTSQGPGGLSDIVMRALAEEMRPSLGQPIVIENRVGASGTIGARTCADAPPD